MDERKKRKLLRASCHGAALASATVVILGVPIAVLVVSDDPYVKDSAREAINFSLTIILWTIAAVILFFSIIGTPIAVVMFGLIGLVSFIMPIIAIVSVLSESEKPYRYPMIFRFIKGSTKAIEADGESGQS